MLKKLLILLFTAILGVGAGFYLADRSTKPVEQPKNLEKIEEINNLKKQVFQLKEVVSKQTDSIVALNRGLLKSNKLSEVYAQEESHEFIVYSRGLHTGSKPKLKPYTFKKMLKNTLIVDSTELDDVSLAFKLNPKKVNKIDSLELSFFDNQQLEFYSYQGEMYFEYVGDSLLNANNWKIISTNSNRTTRVSNNFIFRTAGNIHLTFIVIWEKVGDGFLSFKGIGNIFHEGDYMVGMVPLKIYKMSPSGYLIHGAIQGGDGGEYYGRHWVARMNDQFMFDFDFSEPYEGNDTFGSNYFDSELDSASNTIVLEKRFKRSYPENGKYVRVDSFIWEKKFSLN